jgi:hypothetical protein
MHETGRKYQDVIFAGGVTNWLALQRENQGHCKPDNKETRFSCLGKAGIRVSLGRPALLHFS